jgi:arylsulfatase
LGWSQSKSTGFPAYNSTIPKDTATIGRILLENGYRTSWFGKEHNTPTYQAEPSWSFRPVANWNGL